ncbi:MAG TPA: hypothetical protein ENO12_01885 [Thermoplasmatales archaeon]|nr:hypothetical protein [Thermoplasmatales archaeon]
MKKKSIRTYQAAVVIALSILMIGSTSGLTAATTPQTTAFSSAISSTSFSQPVREEVELCYYDPEGLVNVIGVEDVEVPFKWQSAIRLTTEELGPYADWTLTKVNAGYSADNGQFECYATVIIYDKGDATHPGPIIVNDTTYHFDSSGVHTIPLLTPVPLEGYEELWVSVEWEQTEQNVYLALMDEGPAVDGKGDWGFDGNWSELQIYGLDYNWAIGAIVEGEGNAALSILNIQGPVGVNAEVKNIGSVPAMNMDWSIVVTGGILKKVNKTATGTVANIAVDATEAISLGMFFGLGKIQITITAQAENAVAVSVTKSAVILGPIVIGIK